MNLDLVATPKGSKVLIIACLKETRLMKLARRRKW